MELASIEAIINTLKVAGMGLLGGCFLGVVFSIASLHIKAIDSALGGLIFYLFSSPLIVLVWIIHAWITNTTWASFIFVSLVIAFPFYDQLKRGLRESPVPYIETVFVSGGNNLAASFYVRVWNSLPYLASGLQASWPAAFLAALLSDTASGVHPSLGSYITGSIGQGSITNKIYIALICSLIGFAGHELAGRLVRLTNKKFTSSESGFYQGRKYSHSNSETSRSWNISVTLFKYVISPLVVWHLWATAFPEILPALSPIKIYSFIFHEDEGLTHLKTLGNALNTTLLYSFFGLLATVAIVYMLNILLLVSNKIMSAIDLGMLAFQSTPIIAWLGLLRLLQGEEMLMSVTTAVTASIFPAYVFVKNRVKSIPHSFSLPVRIAGGDEMHVLRYIKMPIFLASLPEVISVVGPRVVLGVMLTEYFLTYKGLGGLMAYNRVGGDREFWWLIIVSVSCMSIVFYVSKNMARYLSVRLRN